MAVKLVNEGSGGEPPGRLRCGACMKPNFKYTPDTIVPDNPNKVFEMCLPTSEGPIWTIDGPELAEGHRVVCFNCGEEYAWDSDWEPHE